MGDVIQFPTRKPDKLSIEEACRLICSQVTVAQKYPSGVRERAIGNVVAVCDRWWLPTISLSWTPQVDFSEQQLADVKRLLQSAAEEASNALRGHVMGERLLHELELENDRARPRAV